VEDVEKLLAAAEKYRVALSAYKDHFRKTEAAQTKLSEFRERDDAVWHALRNAQENLMAAVAPEGTVPEKVQ
jgi:hypothetical protein